MQDGNVAQAGRRLPGRPQVLSKLSLASVVILALTRGRQEVQKLSVIHSEFKASLAFVRLSQETKQRVGKMAQGVKILVRNSCLHPPAPPPLVRFLEPKLRCGERADFTKLSPDLHVCAMSHTQVHLCNSEGKRRSTGPLRCPRRSAWN